MADDDVDDTGIDTIRPTQDDTPVIDAPKPDPVKSPDEAGEAAGARTQAATRLARGAIRKTPEAETPTTITDAAGYEALKPGAKFIDPDGTIRKKPWMVKTEGDYEQVPEGESFIDPDGQVRQKPKYEHVDFTTQTLYNMAINDKERMRALERGYPGKIKKAEGTGKAYVDDGGTLRQPKGFMDAPGAALTAMAAPVVGAIGGEIAGGVGGTFVAPGPGTFAGAVAGGGVGGIAGQAFNDMVLQLAGVYDRSAGEEISELAMSGAFSAGGAAVGRTAVAAYPWAKGKVQNLLPKATAKFVGADEAGLETAISLREKGVDVVPPSGWAKEAPHIQNIVEVFDPAFRTQKPLAQAAAKHYEKSGSDILEDIGVKTEGSLIEPKAAPSTREAGEALLARRVEASAAADQKLEAALAKTREQQAVKIAASTADRTELESAAAESRREAQKMIDVGFKGIQDDIDGAMKATKAGSNSGDLWWGVGEKLKAIKLGISQRAKRWYDQADAIAGNALPNHADLPKIAERVLSEMPEGFEGQYPKLVRDLKSLAGEIGENGEVIKEPVQMTFGQLHNLRTAFRSGVNWYNLTPDFKEGALKFFAHRIDDVLHDAHAVPELKTAAQMLDATDRWYGDAIRPLTDKSINAVMKGLESGMPADPKMLFDTLVKEGRSELTNKVKTLVGPNLWAGVKAADVQEMLDLSKTLVPGEVDGRAFVKQVLDRVKSGMLEAVHGREASAKLLDQARAIEALSGRLPIKIKPGDKLADVINKARQAADAAKEMAKQDPLKVLQQDMKRITNEHRQQLAKQRKDDPLGFIYDPTVGATQAVERILGNDDLILAAGGRFGEKSPEFNLLRQVWAQRLLQGTMDPNARLAKVAPEVQQLMFPGTSLNEMQTLAKEMDFLLGTKGVQGTGKSIAATERVEHPWASIPGGRAVGKLIPGWDATGRYMLGSYYKMITELSSNLTLMKWVLKGLKGDEAAREMSQQAVQRAMQRGGAVGAGVGESQYQTHNGREFDPSSIGAQQAPDGQWYMSDPERPGKYLQVNP